MRLVHWNVNGIRSMLNRNVKGSMSFKQFINQYDIIVLNETKIVEANLIDVEHLWDGYHAYHAFAKRKGYSGVSILSKQLLLNVLTHLFDDSEGRVVILEYKHYILVGVYVPNSGPAEKNKLPKRLTYRTTEWDPKFQLLCSKLEQRKPVIVLGDLNVAYTEMDLARPTKNRFHAGFTDQERNNFGILLESTRFVDIWRWRHPSKIEYTYFDYRTRGRHRNIGWRIDYALISKELRDDVVSCNILGDVEGSDHVPLELILSY